MLLVAGAPAPLADEDREMAFMKCVVACTFCCILTVTVLPDSDDSLRSEGLAGHRVLAIYGRQDNGRSPMCNVIFEDRNGVYWAGTSSGLKLYDESSDRWDDEIRVPWDVNSIGQSADGKLWFARRFLRNNDIPNLVSFDGREWRNIESLPKVKNAIRPGAVTVMFPASGGRLWFARGNELLAYDGRGWGEPLKVSEAIRSEFPVSVRAGLQDSEGNIWLATSEGIVRFNELKRQWWTLDPFGRKGNVPVELKRSMYAEMQIVDGVTEIYEDRKGRVWFASAISGSYFRYDKYTESWSHYTLADFLPANRPKDVDPGFTKMYQDRFGRMMFGTKMGLITFTEDDKEWQILSTQNSKLPDNLITTIFEDRSGRIWVGTGAGIVVLER